MKMTEYHKEHLKIDFETALKKCQESAEKGYEIAKKSLHDIEKSLETIYNSLSNSIANLETGNIKTSKIATEIKKQLKAIIRDLISLRKSYEYDLEERRKNLNNFSITLFGRTMSGKSTLMEILTRGDGSSIGKGAQRTTRDVRTYEWKGLRVTDVPGVAAFEGADDERVAFEAAKKADLILFLITDDAPQPVEAECFAEIRKLGKNIIGICNVKFAVDDEDDLLLFLKKPELFFDQTRLSYLLKQFNELANQHIPGEWTYFVVTHLRSRFLAERPGYEKYRENLIKASRFDNVERHIVKEVISRGSFLRMKSFIDGISVPLMEVIEQLLAFSAKNSTNGKIYIQNKRKVREWEREFEHEAKNLIDSKISKVMNSLREEVGPFAEDHYDDEFAGKKWQQIVNSKNLPQLAEEIQKDLVTKCEKALEEIARELKSEIMLIDDFQSDSHIKMDKITDVRKAWRWGAFTVSSVLVVASLFTPIGWGGLVAGIVATLGGLLENLFESKAEKVRKSMRKLSEQLHKNINNIENDLREKLESWLYKSLLKNQIYPFLTDLNGITSTLFELADAQRKSARDLIKEKKKLDRILIEESLRLCHAEVLINKILDIARIPGYATMLLIEPNFYFPKEVREKLEKLLGEQIWFIVDTKNQYSILAQAVGRRCNRKEIKIEEKIGIAYIPIYKLDTETKERVRLAQQLTGFHIITEKKSWEEFL